METTVSGQSRCLDAFTIALQQPLEGVGWYASTKQLQLASFQFCAACRKVSTLSLIMDDRIPRRLLAAPAGDPPPAIVARAPERQAKRVSRHVPRLKAREVKWNRRPSKELATPIDVLTDAEIFILERGFEGGLGPVAWPSRLKLLTFGDEFDETVDGIEWPSSLEVITFGYHFNQPIDGVKWPSSLVEVRLGYEFSHTIERVVWPAKVEHLSFGCMFNHPIEETAWPASLQGLAFGHMFDQPIEQVSWPASLRSLKFGYWFDHPVDTVTWPAELEQLEFGGSFNQEINRAAWPPSLRQLSLGRCFNKSLHGLGTWMPNLAVLILRMRSKTYAHSIELVQWPPGLQKLTVEKHLWDQNAASFPAGAEVDVFLR